jgi:NAD(P)H-dependent FMN reductase
MFDPALKLTVIIGSTREGRLGETVARWFAQVAEARPDFRVDVVDLAEANLPTVHRDRPTPELEAFAARIDAADAIVVVTPEYNHGYPASLKLAIDSLRPEWQAKPVGFVAYGGMAGGLRAVEQLRQVFAELHAMTVRDTVSFHNAWELFDATGAPRDGHRYAKTAGTMLDQLAWWGRALRDARLQSAYGREAEAA